MVYHVDSYGTILGPMSKYRWFHEPQQMQVIHGQVRAFLLRAKWMVTLMWRIPAFRRKVRRAHSL